MDTTETGVLIVGAGLSGLMASRILREQGVDCLVVERDAMVGGRMATIRLQGGLADLGAQYFIAQNDTFRYLVKQWMEAGVVYVWSQNQWSNGSLFHAIGPDQPYYVARGGMQALAAHLAGDDLNILTRTPIASITPHNGEWLIQDDAGNVIRAETVLLTPPVPLSLQILAMGGTQLAEDDRQSLGQIRYASNFSAVFLIDGQVTLPEPGAIQNPYDAIHWIADNRQKGISGKQLTVTLQTRPEYTLPRWDETDDEILTAMEQRLRPYLATGARVVEGYLKRWSYALPVVTYAEPYLQAAELPPLFFAGDAFGGRGVEGAVLSGLAAGEAIAGMYRAAGV